MLFVSDVVNSKRRIMTKEEKLFFGIEKLNVPRSDIPAVTHVDYSARIQTVQQETNPRYHKLLSLFKSQTGCPVLVNTSFNVRGEPIVCTPEDAFLCFMGTEIEAKMDSLGFAETQIASTAQQSILDLVYRLAAKGILQIHQSNGIPDV